jgi:hypothetical protein
VGSSTLHKPTGLRSLLGGGLFHFTNLTCSENGELLLLLLLLLLLVLVVVVVVVVVTAMVVAAVVVILVVLIVAILIVELFNSVAFSPQANYTD